MTNPLHFFVYRYSNWDRILAYLEAIFQWICRINQVCSNTGQVAAACDHRNNCIVVSNLRCLFDYALESGSDETLLDEFLAYADLSPVMKSSKLSACTGSARRTVSHSISEDYYVSHSCLVRIRCWSVELN